jgi:nucleoid-associated protein YgaU
MPRKKKVKNTINLFDDLRLGESYTSLILGIIVVIVGSILLLTVARVRSVDTQQTSSTKVTRSATKIVDNENEVIISTNTINDKGSRDNKQVVNDNLFKDKQAIKVDSNYTVQDGDNLWNIAERAYSNGFNWIEIARANNLLNENLIEVGTKLNIPKIDKKSSSLGLATPNDNGKKDTLVREDKITDSKYTIKNGDNLWNISIRAYADGYKWVEIAKANKIDNPDLIYAGNKLTLPRK